MTNEITNTEFIISARNKHDLTELQMRTLIIMLRYRRFCIKHQVGAGHSTVPNEHDIARESVGYGPITIKAVPKLQEHLKMGHALVENWDKDYMNFINVLLKLKKKGCVSLYDRAAASKLSRGVFVLPEENILWTDDAFKSRSHFIEQTEQYCCLTSSGFVLASVLETDFVLNGIIEEFSGDLKLV